MSNRNIKVEFEDNNNIINIFINEKKEEHSEMFCCQQNGYSLDSSLIRFANDKDVMTLVHKAIEELNIDEGFTTVINNTSKPSSQKQLLWDAYSALSHGSYDETQDVIKRLAEHFKNKDTHKLSVSNKKRYPN